MRWIRVLVGSLTLFIALCLLPGLALGQSTADRVREVGVLRVGLEGVYPPFSFWDENGMLVGFDVDIAQEIARRLGVKVEFVPMEWTSLIPALQADQIDVIISQMSITEERKQLVDFTVPYIAGRTVLVTRQGDERFTQLNDIAGAKVGVLEETTFEALARSVEGALVYTYGYSKASIDALLAGTVDVIIEDEFTVAYYIHQQGLPLQMAPTVLEQGYAGIAVKKGNEDFLEELNQVLRKMVVDGTYRTIYEKWFGANTAESIEALGAPLLQ